MKHEYIKYRKFLRSFSEFLEEADKETVYEIVGGKGNTVGFFSINKPE